MASLKELTAFLDDFLELDRFADDPSNNGLQFQGNSSVHKAVFGVDACAELFLQAADQDADFIFVHHGISWGNGMKRITGIAADRMTALAANGMSLYAAHLPLDAHEMLGHNALLAGMLDLQDIEPFGMYHGHQIGVRGHLKKAVTPPKLAELLDEKLPSEGDFQIIGNDRVRMSEIGIISGGGAWPDLFDEIGDSPVECLITGEASHEVFHPARETGTTILTIGHYRSETPGVIALMNTVREKFSMETYFADIPTGM